MLTFIAIFVSVLCLYIGDYVFFYKMKLPLKVSKVAGLILFFFIGYISSFFDLTIPHPLGKSSLETKNIGNISLFMIVLGVVVAIYFYKSEKKK